MHFGILHFLQYFTELHAADKQIFPCVAEMTHIRESMPIVLSILQRYTNYFAPDSLDLVWFWEVKICESLIYGTMGQVMPFYMSLSAASFDFGFGNQRSV